MIYLKDIAVVRSLDEFDEQIVEDVLAAVPSEDEIQTIINTREDITVFDKTEMFFQGTAHISSSLSEIRERLVKMAGKIVPEDDEEVFVEQIKKIMNDKMIKAI